MEKAQPPPGAPRAEPASVGDVAAFSELVKALTSTLELSEILRIILERIKTLTRAEALSLLLYDRDRDDLVFAATETLRENAVVGVRLPPGHGVAGWVAQTGQSALVNDPANDPRFYSQVDRASGFKTRSLLAVPLTRQGRVIGVLELANRYDGSGFREEDLVRLEAVAAEVSDALDPEALPYDADATGKLLVRATAVVPSAAAALLLFDGAGGELVFNASREIHAGAVDGLRMRTDQGIAGWVARNRQALRLDDATKDPRHYAKIAALTNLTPRSMLCVPMVSKGELRGVIQAINKLDGSSFTDEELRLTQTLADHAAIAIENAALYHRAYIASITDDLTGLRNTRYLNQVLPEILRRGGRAALLVLDLDNFKEVVDTYGHLAGSQAIGQVGRLIGSRTGPADVAARYGGDEFVVLLCGADGATALRAAEGLRAAIEGLAALEGDAVVDLSGVTASVGVALYPEHADATDALFRAADEAMYSVKRARKNGVALARPRGTAAA